MSIYDNLDTWPTDTLLAREQLWSPKGSTVGGDPSVSGLNRRSRTDGGGWWQCDMSDFFLRKKKELMFARALIARADGGVTLFNVPASEARFAPWPGGVAPARVAYADDVTFDDGSEFGTSGGIVATIVNSAALRATQLRIHVTNGAALIGGEAFTVHHPNKGYRLYLIVRLTVVSAGVYDIEIRTPLREAVSAGDAIDFNNPKCVMKLLNAEDAMQAIRLNRFSDLTLQFQEAF